MPEPDDLSFDAATAVRPTGSPGLFATDVHQLWTVGDKPNGGYLLALLGRAAGIVGRGHHNPDWEVVSSSITYLRPPDLGPASVHTTVLRSGRSAAHARAVLVQDGKDLVDAVFVLGALSGEPEVRYDAVEPLHVPHPEQCVRLPPKMPGGVHVGIMEVLDLRLDPATLPLADPHPAADARAELRGWTRFADGRDPDPLSLLFAVDAIPPATFRIGSTGWVPTLQMSSYVRARPAPGLARDPHDCGPGGRRHGRRDVHLVGQPGVTWWRSRHSWLACAFPTTSPEPPAGSQRTGVGAQPRRAAPHAARTPSSSPSSSSSASWQSHEQYPAIRGEAGWKPQRRHSVVIVVLTFQLEISCIVDSHSFVLHHVIGRPGRKRAAPLWEAAPRRLDSVRVLPTASGPPPGCSAWGSHRSVPRTWQHATDPGSSHPSDLK